VKRYKRKLREGERVQEGNGRRAERFRKEVKGR
jgi:hypothetical protein